MLILKLLSLSQIYLIWYLQQMRALYLETKPLPVILCLTREDQKNHILNRGLEKIGFEGGGDCLFDRGGPWLWTGHGFRTEIEAHPEIANYFDVEVVPIKLIDERFYHIDTCFCPLTGGYVMYHPPAFDYDSRIAIETRIPPEKRIIVDTMDAGNFACNAVNLENKIIVNAASAYLKGQLKQKGFDVIEIELSEFIKAGGSAKCLTLKLIDSVIPNMK